MKNLEKFKSRIITHIEQEQVNGGRKITNVSMYINGYNDGRIWSQDHGLWVVTMKNRALERAHNYEDNCKTYSNGSGPYTICRDHGYSSQYALGYNDAVGRFAASNGKNPWDLYI